MKYLSTFLLRCAVAVATIVVLFICGVTAWWAFIDLNPADKYHYLYYILFSGVCLASIPCLIALLQTYKLLSYIDTNQAFSQLSMNALKMIMWCAVGVFIVCSVGGLPFFYVVAQLEDAPGLVIIGMIISGTAFIIAVFASVLTKLLQDAIDMKSENDLTI